jgi:hypothetical protein
MRPLRVVPNMTGMFNGRLSVINFSLLLNVFLPSSDLGRRVAFDPVDILLWPGKFKVAFAILAVCLGGSFLST